MPVCMPRLNMKLNYTTTLFLKLQPSLWFRLGQIITFETMIYVSYNQKERLKDNPGLLCHEEISSHKTKYLTNHIEMNSRENLTTYLIDSWSLTRSYTLRSLCTSRSTSSAAPPDAASTLVRSPLLSGWLCRNTIIIMWTR